MLAEIGAGSIDELFEQIPSDHRLQRPLELPRQLASESELRRHLADLLNRNGTCEENLSFLGAGCWPHHVPAVVDEIVGRSEFLTPVWGSPQSDHGRNQAWFEFNSQLGELLEMDVVQLPVYSWGCAAGHAIRMASRITGRHQVIVPRWSDPERQAVIRTYCEPREMARHIEVVEVAHDPQDRTDRPQGSEEEALARRPPPSTSKAPPISASSRPAARRSRALAHAVGAEVIVGADPLSLGILRPPADYGADIVVGPTQPLGVHMNAGGGVGGFIASRDEEKYVREMNGFLVSITETLKPGQYGFALASSHQTSYGMREKGKDWTGNSVYLWAIAAAVYMSLLGPQGFPRNRRPHHLAQQLCGEAARPIKGVKVPFGGFFKEFVVDFSGSGRTVCRINDALRQGTGSLAARTSPAKLRCALSRQTPRSICVTEVHTQDDYRSSLSRRAS